MRIAAIRSTTFLLGFFLTATAHDVARRLLSHVGMDNSRVSMLAVEAVLMAIVVLPGAFFAFWRFGRLNLRLLQVGLLGGVLWALIVAGFSLPLDDPWHRGLGMAALFVGPFLVVWVASILSSRKAHG